MIITAIPPSDTHTVQITLQQNDMEVDPRVIEYDYFGYRFECTVQGRILTVHRIDRDVDGEEQGWDETLLFRAYHSKTESVPSFALNGSYYYKGLDGERAPYDISEGFVDASVTIIQYQAFYSCRFMKKCTMLGDKVTDIEEDAFAKCVQMKNIRLSRVLEYIGLNAFDKCLSLDALFLPSTLRKIAPEAFFACQCMRIAALPDEIEIEDVGEDSTMYCESLFPPSLEQNQLGDDHNDQGAAFVHLLDDIPLVKLCSSATVTARMIQDCIQEHGTIVAKHMDHHNLTPLHILSMNPHIHDNESDGLNAFISCFMANKYALVCHDDKGKTPLDYLWENNYTEEIIHAIAVLCVDERNSYIDNMCTVSSRKRKRME